MANGYMGKVLWVDLTTKKISAEALDEKLCRQYLGGYGLGARILFSRQKAGVDALGPDNILGFLTGPFTGTNALGGSRYIVVGKSPLTGTWGDANSGGSVGPTIKFAGYDAVFFTGISAKPVYLFIDNGKGELHEASHLWGKDTFDTEDVLKSELGKETEIACIGPSGENLSLIAAIMNNQGRAAARSGLGAVMGSKRLKAIAVKGTMKVPVFDEAKIVEIRKRVMEQLGGPINLFRGFGTVGITVPSALSGDSPVKNWAGVTTVDFPTVEKIGGKVVVALQEKKYGCYHCVVGCGGHMKEGTGDYKYKAGAHKPEYETMCLYGSNCLNDNVESIIKVNDICNRFGLDTISAGATIAMAIECYENGLITKKETDGIEMTWGNHKSIVAMTEKMARRDGFGAILADGARVAAEKIGKSADKYAMHIQGQEYPAHEPKLGLQWAIAYRMDATPGRHTRGGGPNPPGLPVPSFDKKAFSGRSDAHKIQTGFNHCIDSLGLCSFVYGCFPDAGVVLEFINAITGWNITMDDMLIIGERIANIRHSFNIREGLNPLQFKIPDRIAGKPPFAAGPLAGVTLDEQTMDNEYCQAMDWDSKTARPSRKKLIELSMEDVAESIWR